MANRWTSDKRDTSAVKSGGSITVLESSGYSGATA
jgi:hypothetical protein